MSKNEMESKESMQNTIKTLQARSENIEKLLEKGNDVVVFQLGSHSIKFGFANQSSPHKIRTLLGYKLSKSKENPIISNKNDNFEDIETSISSVENILRKKGNLRLETKGYKGKPKPKIESNIKVLESNDFSEHLMKKNMKLEPENIILTNKGTLSYNPNAIFEKDLFSIEQNQDYIITQPIKHGLFNISDKISQDQVINDLETLILYCLNKKLGIPTKNFPNFSIILIIPDIFIRQQIKGLVNVFLRTLEFKYIYIHLESILACFGACLSQACVVDIGYEKISISCVDEGLILHGTMIKKNFGGADLDQIFIKMLNKKHCITSSSKNFKLEPTLLGDLAQMERLKEESSCFTFREEFANKHYECSVIRAHSKPTSYEKFFVGPNEACYIIPSLLFYCETLNILNKDKSNNKSSEYFNTNSKIFEWNDPEDNLEDGAQNYVSMFQSMQNYLVSNEKSNKDFDQLSDSSKHTGSKIKLKLTEKDLKIDEPNSKNPKKNDENNNKSSQNETPGNNIHANSPFLMESLDELICYSISQIKESSMRKKMANSILLIGGTSQISKFVEELEDRMIETIAKYDSDIERVEVVDLGNKESTPENLSWVGGSILAKLDSIKNLWISRNRWLGLGEDEDEYDEDGEKKQKRERTQEVGIKYLKEKVPFSW